MDISINGKKIGPDTLLKRKSDLLFNQIDGEVVLLSIENGEYYGMDAVGSRIWELLEDAISLRVLIFKLMNEYDVSEVQCQKDTMVFIEMLIEKDLLHY